MSIKIRKYGKGPYKLAAIHGGPGGAGEMEPVAHALAVHFGVLEPIQNAKTVGGQIEELKYSLESLIDKPITLAGHSWGAWLSFLLAAQYPKLVSKLILISSGPFEAIFAKQISENRMKQFNDEQKTEYLDILNRLNNNESSNKDGDLFRLGKLAKDADIFEPVENMPFATPPDELTENAGEIFEHVWAEAAELRASGKLLQSAKHINCPLVIVHGLNDSHPVEGVKKPLSQYIKKMQCHILEQCGHYPWLEKNACEKFFEIMKRETLPYSK